MDVEIIYPFQVAFKVLKFFGIWIDGEETRKYRIYGYSMILLGPILFLITLTAGILKKGLSVDVADPMTFAVAVFVENIRIIEILFKIHLIKSLYKSIEQATIKNVKNLNVIKRWTYPIAVPFDFDKTEIGFWMTNFYTLYASSYVAPLYATTGLLPLIFMAFLVGFMEDFNERIVNFGKIANSKLNEIENEKILSLEL
jgi:hypothetical protein